jgi:multimeric flavodoxin WrbA
VQDDLSAVLNRVKGAEAPIIGTPVYYGAESAATRAFLERLCFPYKKYAKNMGSLFPKRINTAMIYTMNAPEVMRERMGYDQIFGRTKMMLGTHFGACELLFSTDTLQYSEYDKFAAEIFNKEGKYKRHAEVFPEDCKRALALGVRMASGEIPEPLPR